MTGTGPDGNPARCLPRQPPVRGRRPSPPIVTPPVCDTQTSQATGVRTTGIGGSGVNDAGSPRPSVLDGPPCANGRADAVPSVDCSSIMLTSLRSTISAGIDATPATSISTPYMGLAMTRKAGNKVTIFRWVDVTRYQDTEERGEEKFSRPVLEQREAARSASRL